MSNSSLSLHEVALAFGNPNVPSALFGEKLAASLLWTRGNARVERLYPPSFPARVERGLFGNQPAAIFVSHDQPQNRDLLKDAALLAYHNSIEWGVVTNSVETSIFNSHWIRNDYWYALPPLSLTDLQSRGEIIQSLTPEGLASGKMEHVASQVYKPDRMLASVDDALVSKLDDWRNETLRHTRTDSQVDETLQTLFAQLFVLRVIEDRLLRPELPTLESVINKSGEADHVLLEALFEKASLSVQSELFHRLAFRILPEFVLGGIIKDLYYPSYLPHGAKYNFAWIDADVLGQAYQKYISTLLVPIAQVAPQLQLWNQPLREVERMSVRKAAGIYYTPSFLVRSITEQCLETYYAAPAGQNLPRIVDPSCGSGTFLTTAADALINRLRHINPQHNWGRQIVKERRVIGIDNDKRAVTIARLALWLRLAQEPDALPLPDLDDIIVHGDSLLETTWNPLPRAGEYDIVLGNPPFIATGNVQNRKQLEERFQTAKGRFDYSYLFIELGIEKLREGGVLGMVVPNRLFTNQDAHFLRRWLTTGNDLITLIDFGTNKVFAETSSYIGVLLVRKGRSTQPKETVRFVKVVQLPSLIGGALAQACSSSTEYSSEHVLAYIAPHPRGEAPWLFLSPHEKSVRVRLSLDSPVLDEIANIYQGIKTGANDIFIVALESPPSGSLVYVVNGFGDRNLVERDILQPVIYGSEIRRYDVVKPEKYLIYPYRDDRVIDEISLREEYPETYRYLVGYHNDLANRSTTKAYNRKWYELSWGRSENWLKSPKLLIRDLAKKPAFAIDPQGTIFLVGGSAIVPQDPSIVMSLLGYMNSRIVNWYLSPMTPSFRGDYQKFEPQHLAKIPIPTALFETEIAEQLAALTQQIIEAAASGQSDLLQEKEDEVDTLLSDVLGIERGYIV